MTALRNLVADKDIELDNLRRDTRTSHVKEMEAALDEYQGEIVRLLRLSDDLKEELFREKARREWNCKYHLLLPCPILPGEDVMCLCGRIPCSLCACAWCQQ